MSIELSKTLLDEARARPPDRKIPREAMHHSREQGPGSDRVDVDMSET